MFKLKRIKTVKWPVTVQVPVDGGRTEKAEFEAEFRYMDDQALEDLLLRTEGRNRGMLTEVVEGWDESLLDEDGNPLTFSRDNLARLVSHPYVAGAMVNAFLEMQRGARVKN